MSRTFLLAAVFVTCGWVSSSALSETWVDLSGNFRIDAEFAGVEGKVVILKKPDGSILRVPISKLSAESVATAKRLYLMSKQPGGEGGTPAASGTQSLLGDDPTLERTLEVIQELDDNADPSIAWDMLPASHRKDVNDLAQLLARSVDPPTWNAVIAVIKKMHRLIDEKQDFIVNSSFIPPNVEKQTVQQAIGAFEPMLGELLQSDLVQQSAMKNFDGDLFFETQYPKLRDSALVLASVVKAAAPQGWPQPIKETSYKIVSIDGDSAVVKVSSSEGDEDQAYRRVDNRWMLAKTADDWDMEMGKARSKLEALQTPQGKQSLAQARQMISIGSMVFDPLLNVKTQAEFDQAAAGFAKMASTMLSSLPQAKK